MYITLYIVHLAFELSHTYSIAFCELSICEVVIYPFR